MEQPAASDHPLPHEAAERGPRQARGIPWGAPKFPFKLAQVFSRGAPIGWGATCFSHCDRCDTEGSVPCKKQVTYGRQGRSDAECRRLLKLWLVAGFQIDPRCEDARRQHVRLDAPRLGRDDASSEADLDRLVETL